MAFFQLTVSIALSIIGSVRLLAHLAVTTIVLLGMSFSCLIFRQSAGTLPALYAFLIPVPRSRTFRSICTFFLFILIHAFGAFLMVRRLVEYLTQSPVTRATESLH